MTETLTSNILQETEVKAAHPSITVITVSNMVEHGHYISGVVLQHSPTQSFKGIKCMSFGVFRNFQADKCS